MKKRNKCRREGDKTKYFVLKSGEKGNMGECFWGESGTQKAERLTLNAESI
jgi:hypothetical protein